MSKIDELIEELCPGGVEFKTLGGLLGAIPRGRRLTKSNLPDNGSIPVFHGGLEPIGFTDQPNTPAMTVMVINVGASAGTVGWSEKPFWCSDGCFALPHSNSILPKFLYYCALDKQEFFVEKVRRAGIPTLAASSVLSLSIPVPPIKIQEEIVSILDKFTQLEAELEAELEARRTQYEVTRDRLLDFTFDLESHPLKKSIAGLSPRRMKKISLDDLTTIVRPRRTISRTDYQDAGPVPIIDQSQSSIAGYTDEMDAVNDLGPCVVFGDHTRAVKFVDFPFAAGADGTVILDVRPDVIPRYFYFIMTGLRIESRGYNRHWTLVRQIEVPVPPIDLQKEIVSNLDTLDALVNDITIGLPAEIAARRKQYEYYRSKLLTFKELDAA
jgi:type I restriction enzyme S subunit